MKKVIALLLSLMLVLACVSTALAADYEWAFIKKIPMKPKYTAAVDQHGTVERVVYTTHAYITEEANPGSEVLVEKAVYVYLPYGYDPAKSYNVLYTMHGAGEDETYWLTPERMGKGTLAMLDNLYSTGAVEPTIIVTPTTNNGTVISASEGIVVEEVKGNGPNMFWKELRNDLIPVIETKYSSFANGDVSEAGLKATREHRAFTGFSMGSVTTLAVMQNCLDLFAYIGNYSDVSIAAGRVQDGKFDEFFAVMESEEFKDLPIKFWYHGEGSADYAVDGHKVLCAQILERMSDRVTDGVNYAYVEFKGGTHAYNCWLPHLYNCMLVFFK